MGEFLREASIGSIVLVAVGAVLAIFVSPVAPRRGTAPQGCSRGRGECGGPPVSSGGQAVALFEPDRASGSLDVLGWTLVGVGLALWIFD